MKALKNILAISIIAATGTANAATVATFTVTATDSTAFSNTSATGTGTLSDTGTLSIHFDSQTASVPVLSAQAVVQDINDTFLGTLSGGTYTATSGTEVINGPCSGNSTICSSAQTGFGTPVTLTITGGNIALSGPSTLTFTSSPNNVTNTSSYALVGTPSTTPAVPVPAAAWLFGSGLLGLAGSARSRAKK